MDLKLLEILCCPTCQAKLNYKASQFNSKGHVVEGELLCPKCTKVYPIIRSVPRFISMDNYADSFGYQWNLYKYTQVDRFSKTKQSQQRFYLETGWTKETMQNNWVLEVGCGNGRFLEVSSRSDCQVVGVDMSSAIDAAQELYQDKDNVHLIQASIYELPFREQTFDKCYCIGVIQHTPSPKKSITALQSVVKKNGELALTIYERKPWTLLYGKYLLRPLTTRINKKLLLWSIKIVSPLLFIMTEILFRIPFLGKCFKFIIPYANYVEMTDLSMKQRYEWAILDTFDMLSPAYDSPMTEKEVCQCLELCDIKNITRLPNPGVNVVTIK
ncbi:MAG: methyltransferase domain-containing protein [Gammaproteobacteria bacterium]|nr:methyltransferase domain-containing protein [Gammaproteobacteria bacterium]